MQIAWNGKGPVIEVKKGLVILALSVAGCIALTKSLNCFEPQFILLCKMEEIVSVFWVLIQL